MRTEQKLATIDTVQEVGYEKSIGTKMSDLDLCIAVFDWYQNQLPWMTLNGQTAGFRITISSEMAIFSLFTQKYVANDK